MFYTYNFELRDPIANEIAKWLCYFKYKPNIYDIVYYHGDPVYYNIFESINALYDWKLDNINLQEIYEYLFAKEILSVNSSGIIINSNLG